jgi:hypothetical protein
VVASSPTVVRITSRLPIAVTTPFHGKTRAAVEAARASIRIEG